MHSDPVNAIIGGSSAYHLLQSGSIPTEKTITVETPYGSAPPIHLVRTPQGGSAWFLSRHGETHYALTAPFVNYRAIIYALKSLGVCRVLAWSGPGSMKADRFHPGDWVLPHDLIDETHSRPSTFFSGKRWGFIRSHPTFCPNLREKMSAVLAQCQCPFESEAVYVCTEGPRLETAAEIRKYAMVGGDLVGMTLAPEAFLARELEMCYAPLCYITNYAEGIVDRPLRPDELFGGMLDEREQTQLQRCLHSFPRILLSAIDEMLRAGSFCHCASSMSRYKKEGRFPHDWRDWVDQSVFNRSTSQSE